MTISSDLSKKKNDNFKCTNGTITILNSKTSEVPKQDEGAIFTSFKIFKGEKL
jgi:hypothetical protein